MLRHLRVTKLYLILLLHRYQNTRPTMDVKPRKKYLAYLAKLAPSQKPGQRPEGRYHYSLIRNLWRTAGRSRYPEEHCLQNRQIRSIDHPVTIQIGIRVRGEKVCLQISQVAGIND